MHLSSTLEQTCRRREPFGIPFGALWDPLGPTLGSIGPLLASTWASLGVPLGSLGRQKLLKNLPLGPLFAPLGPKGLNKDTKQ